MLAQARVATVGPQVALTLADDFRDYSELTPRARHDATLSNMLTDLISWSHALQGVRNPT